MTQKSFNVFVWSLLLLSVIIPVTVWGNNIEWQVGTITIYQWFPLFGLLAWMIMWTHYATGAIKIKSNLNNPKYYGKLTAYIVLASLLLHPGLLAYAQWVNTTGLSSLPPLSFYEYVGEELKFAVILGSISLMIFLSFEIFDRLKNNVTIKKWWIAVSISQSLAMIFIFVHGLRLGSNLNSGWFVYVWLVYGLFLLPCFYIIHTQDFQNRAKNQVLV